MEELLKSWLWGSEAQIQIFVKVQVLVKKVYVVDYLYYILSKQFDMPKNMCLKTLSYILKAPQRCKL